MRVAIVDDQASTARALAAAIEAMVPTADVLLYDSGPAALTALGEQQPDVAFVAPTIGPSFLRQARDSATDAKWASEAKWVGVVDEPNAESSTDWVAAGAKVVLARPVDKIDLRAALRNAGGGIDP